MGGALTKEQLQRIRTKIDEIGQDVDYLVRTGAKGLVFGGSALRGADFQQRRAELLQQVLEMNDVDAIRRRADRALTQAAARVASGAVEKAEEDRLEAALLLWAIGEGDSR